jgi:hypothetical protein
VIEYIQDYLVNSFLKSVRAKGGLIFAVNTLMSIDLMFVVRAILTYYGLGNYLNVMFWAAVIL